MSYHCGTRGLSGLGIPDGSPRVECDGCGLVWNIDGPPPRWFLAGKPPRNWAGGKLDGKRWDLCPRCKAIRIKELEDAAGEHPGRLIGGGR